jgi:hypothetical protein
MAGVRARRRPPSRSVLCIVFFVFIVIAIMGFPALSKVRNEPRVLWFDFNRDVISILNSAGFTVIGANSMSPEEIRVPLRAHLRMMLRFRDRVRLPADELEPTTLRIVAHRPGRGEVRCLARYHAGYIATIVLRYPRGLENEARMLKKVLHEAYPLERIELEEDPALP